MPYDDPYLTTFDEWVDIFMNRSMRRFIQYARNSRLSMSMIGTLFHLHRAESIGVTDLGEHLGVTSAAVSQMLEKLVQQDLIERSEDPDDRRVKKLILTKKGCQVLEEGTRAQKGWLLEFNKSLSEEEKQQITDAMQLMVGKAKLLG